MVEFLLLHGTNCTVVTTSQLLDNCSVTAQPSPSPQPPQKAATVFKSKDPVGGPRKLGEAACRTVTHTPKPDPRKTEFSPHARDSHGNTWQQRPTSCRNGPKTHTPVNSVRKIRPNWPGTRENGHPATQVAPGGRPNTPSWHDLQRNRGKPRPNRRDGLSKSDVKTNSETLHRAAH